MQTSVSPFEPTVVERFGAWELVEGFQGRSLRRRPRSGLRPHVLLGFAVVVAASWNRWNGALDDRAWGIMIAFAALVLWFGSRADDRHRRELRFCDGELTWATKGEPTGLRWPRSELAAVELSASPKDVPPSMQRRVRPRYTIAVLTNTGERLPFTFVLTDARAARALAARIADEARLEVRGI